MSHQDTLEQISAIREDVTSMKDDVSFGRLEKMLDEYFPISTDVIVITARHVVAGFATLVDLDRSNSAIPANVRNRAKADKSRTEIDVAIDWLGFIIAFPSKAAGHDAGNPVRTALSAVYDELKAKFEHRTSGQKGMRHISVVRNFTDISKLNEAISYAVAVTSNRKDVMNHERLEDLDQHLDAMVAKIQEQAKASSENYYDTDHDQSAEDEEAALAPVADTTGWQ